MTNTIKNRDELLRLININIGANIYQRRMLLKVTRSHLSKKIGSSIESIRQYELGNNNISAASLFITSLALDMPVESFFSASGQSATYETEHDKILRIVKDFFNISSPHLAASAVALIMAVVEELKSLKESVS